MMDQEAQMQKPQMVPPPPQGQMPQAPGQAPMMDDDDIFGEGQMATPEEEDARDRVVGRAFQLIYSEAMFPKILEQLKGGGNPQEGLARTTAMIVAKMADAVNEKANEVSVSADAAMNAGIAIFEDLAELSRRAGIKDYSQDPDAFEGAFFSAIDQYRVMAVQSGQIRPDEFQADFQRLQDMDGKGKLEGRIQRLAESDAAAMAGQSGSGEQMPPQGGLMPKGAM